MLKKEIINDYIRIIIGATLTAAAVTVFFDPNKMITGGVSGLCIIAASYALDWFGLTIPLSFFSVLFNLPLLLIGYFTLGRSFIWRTVFATIYFSAALSLTTVLPIYQGDYFIAAVFGGVVTGIGVGLTLRSLATTGGSDLFASIVNKLNKRISVANAIFAFDAAVIALGFLIFGVESGLYAIISVFISSQVIDYILEGFHFSKVAFIISSKSDEIADEVMAALERGVTGLKGIGMYKRIDTNVLLCVVSKKEIYTLKLIVKSHDPNAFMLVTDARETLGEGFQPH